MDTAIVLQIRFWIMFLSFPIHRSIGRLLWSPGWCGIQGYRCNQHMLYVGFNSLATKIIIWWSGVFGVFLKFFSAEWHNQFIKKIDLWLHFSSDFHNICKRSRLIAHKSEDAKFVPSLLDYHSQKGLKDQEPSCRRQKLPNFQQKPTTLKSNWNIMFSRKQTL